MTHLIWSAATLSILCPVAHANLIRSNTLERIEVPREHLPFVQSLPKQTTPVPPPPQADLALGTKILLDGKPCDFKAVPSNAAVARVVLAPDGKTIVQIEFTTAK